MQDVDWQASVHSTRRTVPVVIGSLMLTEAGGRIGDAAQVLQWRDDDDDDDDELSSRKELCRNSVGLNLN
jgi:hypothetical protein